MTPKHWNSLIKGARHRLLDDQETQITGAIAMARMNNGKDIKPLMRQLEEKRALIDKSKDQHDYDKQMEKRRRKHVREVQKARMREWWQKVNK